LLAGDGGDLKSTSGLTVAAEIVAQAKGEKVTVFKKRRRHNYRRKKGHRQQHTILKIVAIGDHKAPKSEKAAAAPKSDAKPAKATAEKGGSAPAAQASQKPADRAKEKSGVEGDQQRSGDVAGAPTENPAPSNQKAANAPKDAAKKPAGGKAAAKPASTRNAAPAKGGAKKSPKAK
jgi:large subunit ribosomal protein L21